MNTKRREGVQEVAVNVRGPESCQWMLEDQGIAKEPEGINSIGLYSFLIF